MIELSFFDPVNLETFNRLVAGKRDDTGTLIQKGMPPGLFIDKRFHLIPHHRNKTPFKLRVDTPGDSLSVDIAYISVLGELDNIPNVTIVPQFVDTIQFLPIREGLNLVSIINKVNPNDKFTVIVNSRNYGTIMMAYSQELFPSLEAIREQTQAIFNSFATRLMEPLVDRSDLLPDIQVIQGMALRFIGISQLAQPSSDIGVENMAKSLSSNTPVFDPHTQTNTLLPAQFKIFTAQELFGGFAGHIWFPNNQLNRWLSFQRLITNLDLDIKQYDENIIEFTNLFGEDELHIFDTSIQESLLDFRKNVNNFDVLTRIISTTRIPIPAGYPFDLVVTSASPLGNARLSLDVGVPFDQDAPFDGDPIDPLHDGFVGIPLTGRFNFDGFGKPVWDSMIGSDPTYNPPSPTGFVDGYFTHDLVIYGNEVTFDETVGAASSVILPTIFGPNRYSEQIAEVTTTSSSFSAVTSLTETFGSGELYVGFVSWMQQGGSSVETRVTDDGTIKSHNIFFNEATTDYVSCGAFFHFTGAGAARTILLEMASTNNVATVRVKDARMLVYHINTTIDYAEVAAFQTDATTMLTAYQTYQTVTFTPAFAENHIIVASQDISSDSTTDDIFAELDVNGTPIGEAQFRLTSTSERRNITFVWVANLTASAKTIRTRFRASGGTETVSIRNGTLAVVPFGSFTGEIHAATSTEVSKHTGPGFTDGVGINWTPPVNNPYYWLASSRTRVDDTTKSIQFRLNTAGGFPTVPVQHQPIATTSYVPSILANRDGSGTTARTDKIEYAGGYGANKFLDDQVIFALSLEQPIVERLLSDSITTLEQLLRSLELFRSDNILVADVVFQEQKLERLIAEAITLLDSTFGSHMTFREFAEVIDTLRREAQLEQVIVDNSEITDVRISQRIVQTNLVDFIQPGAFPSDSVIREATMSPIITDFIQPGAFPSDVVRVSRVPLSHLVEESIKVVDGLIRALCRFGVDNLTNAQLTDSFIAFKVAERFFSDGIQPGAFPSDNILRVLDRNFPDSIPVTEFTKLINDKRFSENIILNDLLALSGQVRFEDSISVVDSIQRILDRSFSDNLEVADSTKQNEVARLLSDSINVFDADDVDTFGEFGQRREREHIPMQDSVAMVLERLFTDSLQLHDTFGSNTLYKEHLTVTDTLRFAHREKYRLLVDDIAVNDNVTVS